MIQPDADVVLSSVIVAVERDIAAAVTDDYAASLCRTVAQMLRSVRVRVRMEQEALADDNRELRTLLGEADPDLPEPAHQVVAAAVQDEPPPRYPALADLQADAVRLRSALSALIEAVPDEGNPVRVSALDYLRHHLERERQWQQDAFTGPRR